MAIKLYEATKGDGEGVYLQFCLDALTLKVVRWRGDICSNLEYDGCYTISIEELEGLMSYLQIEIDKIKKDLISDLQLKTFDFDNYVVVAEVHFFVVVLEISCKNILFIIFSRVRNNVLAFDRDQ